MFAPGKYRWYDVFSKKILCPDAKNRLCIDLTWDNFGLFIKEGSIIPTYDLGDEVIKSTEQLRESGKQKYNLNVCLDKNKRAEGFLYIDDGKTLDY